MSISSISILCYGFVIVYFRYLYYIVVNSYMNFATAWLRARWWKTAAGMSGDDRQLLSPVAHQTREECQQVRCQCFIFYDGWKPFAFPFAVCSNKIVPVSALGVSDPQTISDTRCQGYSTLWSCKHLTLPRSMIGSRTVPQNASIDKQHLIGS